MKSSTFASPALGPVGLDFGRLVGIIQCIVPVLFGSISGRSVGVEDVVFGLKSDGLSELVTARCQSFCFTNSLNMAIKMKFAGISEGSSGVMAVLNLHSLVKVLVGDGLVAQSFELVCGSHGGRRIAGEVDGCEVQFAAGRHRRRKLWR